MVIGIAIAAMLFSLALTGLIAYGTLRKREGAAFAATRKRLFIGAFSVPIAVAGIAILLVPRVEWDVMELCLLGAGSVLEVAFLIGHRRARSQAGSPLPFAQAAAPKPNRAGSSLLVVAAGLFVLAMAVDRQVTIVGVARVLFLVQSALFSRAARSFGARLHEAGIMGSLGLLPWTQVQAYRFTVYQRAVSITFLLRQPWWFRSTVDLSIPRSELDQVSAWLSGRIPCVGSQVHPSLPQAATP